MLMRDQPLEAMTEDMAVANWDDWSRAENKLSNECNGCSGRHIFDLDRMPLLSCERPAFDAETGEVVWKRECPIQVAFRQEYRVRQLLGKARLPRRFQRRRLENFQAEQEATRRALGAARAFVKGFGSPEQRGLLLMGPQGTGKTHLAAGIVLDLLDCMIPARFYTAPDLLSEIKGAIPDDRVQEVLRGLCEVPCLVIDDLGKEYIRRPDGSIYESAAWAQEQMFTLINRRYEEDRPVVITTNLTDAEMTNRYGPAITSRLSEMCDVFVMDVPDYRRKKPE